MKEIYLDMRRGIAGDIFVSAAYAFMDRTGREALLTKSSRIADELGLRFRMDRVSYQGLEGFRISVDRQGMVKPIGATTAKDTVMRCCDAAGISEASRLYAEKVIDDIITAEAEAHGVRPEEVHLHEIGRPAGLANIALAAVCMDILDLHTTPLIGSYISIGDGEVDTAHGRLSVPTPAVAILLEGLRFRFGPFGGEMATPTGIALVKNAIRHQVDSLPRASREGIGFGTRNFGSEPGYVRMLEKDEEGE
jgi:uncharacterized protein (DUF111 family)